MSIQNNTYHIPPVPPDPNGRRTRLPIFGRIAAGNNSFEDIKSALRITIISVNIHRTSPIGHKTQNNGFFYLLYDILSAWERIYNGD